MGYSKNPRTLEKIRHLLTDLEKGLSCTWRVEPGLEDRWAYKVREALYIAKLHRAEYPYLATAADNFKIEIAQRGLVRASLASNSSPTTVVGRSTGVVNHGLDADMPGLAHKVHSVSTTGRQTPQSIMEAWFHSQPSNTPIYFPDAALSKKQLLELHGLASQQNLIFFESDGAITIQHKTADLEGLSWHPDDLSDEGEVVDLSFIQPD